MLKVISLLIPPRITNPVKSKIIFLSVENKKLAHFSIRTCNVQVYIREVKGTRIETENVGYCVLTIHMPTNSSCSKPAAVSLWHFTCQWCPRDGETCFLLCSTASPLVSSISHSHQFFIGFPAPRKIAPLLADVHIVVWMLLLKTSFVLSNFSSLLRFPGSL